MHKTVLRSCRHCWDVEQLLLHRVHQWKYRELTFKWSVSLSIHLTSTHRQEMRRGTVTAAQPKRAWRNSTWASQADCLWDCSCALVLVSSKLYHWHCNTITVETDSHLTSRVTRVTNLTTSHISYLHFLQNNCVFLQRNRDWWCLSHYATRYPAAVIAVC